MSRLQKQMPTMELVPFDGDSGYPAVLVICGCTAQCARQEDLPENAQRFVLKEADEYEQILAFLRNIDKEM